MKEELLKTIKDRRLLLEKEIYDLVESFNDIGLAKDFLSSLEEFSGQKIITRKILNKNFGFVQGFVSGLPGENKKLVENIFVKLGLSLEITKESKVVKRDVEKKEEEREKRQDYGVFYADTKADRKIVVGDFVGSFRSRYQQLQRILMSRQELQQNLVSINKISGDRQNVCIIGMVTEKRTTKNKNLIIKFEDLTGEINALIKFDREEIFEKGRDR
jgi:DNA polymerase II small subunit/DNA polymerase delta subunit B